MPRLPALTMTMSITFLGCGKLGSAILEGLLMSVYNQVPVMKSSLEDDGINTLDVKSFIPTSLIACVHRQSSADALLAKHENDSIVHVLTNANVEGASLGDVIILGCKPTAYKDILCADGMKDALSRQKLLINLMVGVSSNELSEAIYGPGPFSKSALESQCAIVNCIPNTAAAVRQSMTLIYEDEAPLPAWALEKIVALFSKVGNVKRIPYSLKHLAPIMSTLTASTAAFFVVALEGVAQGAIEQGLNQVTAMEIAAASMRGAAELVASGNKPEDVRQRIATKGGSTAKGLQILEEQKVMPAMAEAMKKASEAAVKMGNEHFWQKKSEQERGSEEQMPQDQTSQAEDAQDEDVGK